MERRLAAILAADVVGYSRLMGANEVGTLNALNHRRTEVIEPRIAGSNGRVVKLTGDGILAEFPSVVDAVECALAIQREMKSRNVEIPEDRRIELRIGIHLGDVIVEDGDLFGDGVNVAARIESVGRPGGVAVSAAVKDNVGNRLDVAFEDMGEHQLKNIAQPIQVFNVGTPQPAAAKGAAAPDVVEEEAKPSIAVLPFNNMSGDPEQEYFSDGITEDIITDLSKISGLFVVGRNTSFTYKGKSIQLQQVAGELGVKFLLEGSVRKAGDRIRVTGQLIDGPTGGHVWADRYDRDLTDIFAIQDEITKTIVDQLKIRLLPDEKKAITQAPTGNVEAYTNFLRGREYYHFQTKRFVLLARQMFTKATELDPGFARAFAGIANCDARLIGTFGEIIPAEEILAVTEKALSLDPKLGEAHAAHGEALAALGRTAEAKMAFERALQLDPNSFEANYSYGRFCFRTAEQERAAMLFRRALELQSDEPQAPLMLSLTLQAMGKRDEAMEYARLGLKRAEEALRQHPESSRPAQLGAAVLATLGDTERAKEWMNRALEVDPDDRLALYNAACTWSQIGDPDRAMDYLERWAKVAAPETREWIKHDPDIHPLRGEPRYTKLIELIDHDAREVSAAASTGMPA
ncbi:MAG: tetratricopeptide repeat protein [Sphingomicrobium sp.]